MMQVQFRRFRDAERIKAARVHAGRDSEDVCEDENELTCEKLIENIEDDVPKFPFEEVIAEVERILAEYEGPISRT